jgi:hypothetical protein
MQRKEYPDGSVYEGVLVDGKRHGEGKYTYADGDVYKGEWRDDKRHGQGKYTFASGVVYEGAWRDDKQHGEGEYTLASGVVWRGVCDKGTPTLTEMRAAAQLPVAAPVGRAVDTSAPTHPAERHTPEGTDGGGDAGDDTEVRPCALLRPIAPHHSKTRCVCVSQSPPRKKRKRASKWTRRKASRQAAGGSGVMEGEQEFDYGEVTRRCLPPGPRHCPDGARLEEHRKALCVGTPPPAILYTDEASCALDSFNMGVGYAAISRADLEGDAEACPYAAPAEPFGAATVQTARGSKSTAKRCASARRRRRSSTPMRPRARSTRSTWASATRRSHTATHAVNIVAARTSRHARAPLRVQPRSAAPNRGVSRSADEPSALLLDERRLDDLRQVGERLVEILVALALDLPLVGPLADVVDLLDHACRAGKRTSARRRIASTEVRRGRSPRGVARRSHCRIARSLMPSPSTSPNGAKPMPSRRLLSA